SCRPAPECGIRHQTASSTPSSPASFPCRAAFAAKIHDWLPSSFQRLLFCVKWLIRKKEAAQAAPLSVAVHLRADGVQIFKSVKYKRPLLLHHRAMLEFHDIDLGELH